MSKIINAGKQSPVMSKTAQKGNNKVANATEATMNMPLDEAINQMTYLNGMWHFQDMLDLCKQVVPGCDSDWTKLSPDDLGRWFNAVVDKASEAMMHIHK